MTSDRLLPPSVTKEFRALLPVWAASVVAVCAGAWAGYPWAAGFSYSIGCVVLGAQSMGHEYSDRTLAVLMSQPLDRRRVFLTKIAALASFLVTLSVLAWAVLVASGRFRPPAISPQELTMWTPALSGLLLAPWLTMLCRSALGGAVFTIALPALVFLAAQIGVAALHGSVAPDAEALGLMVWSRGMIVLYASAAVLGWRTFRRLETIDENGLDMRMPQWLLSAGRVRVGHPLWPLISKELHLQQMTFVVVALYVAGWSTMAVLKHLVPALATFPLAPLTALYLILLSVLIGALASAEERQFGTLEWHLLLPMPVWQQWAVKAAVAIGLALVLGVGVPAVFEMVTGADDDLAVSMAWGRMTALLVLLTTCSLYVSSLCASGVRALVWSVPVVLASVWLMALVNMAAWWVLPHLVTSGSAAVAARIGSGVGYRRLNELLTLAFGAGYVVLLLLVALANHRSVERSVARVWRQAAWIASALTLGVLLVSGFWILYAMR